VEKGFETISDVNSDNKIGGDTDDAAFSGELADDDGVDLNSSDDDTTVGKVGWGRRLIAGAMVPFSGGAIHATAREYAEARGNAPYNEMVRSIEEDGDPAPENNAEQPPNSEYGDNTDPPPSHGFKLPEGYTSNIDELMESENADNTASEDARDAYWQERIEAADRYEAEQQEAGEDLNSDTENTEIEETNGDSIKGEEANGEQPTEGENETPEDDDYSDFGDLHDPESTEDDEQAAEGENETPENDDYSDFGDLHDPESTEDSEQPTEGESETPEDDDYSDFGNLHDLEGSEGSEQPTEGESETPEDDDYSDFGDLHDPESTEDGEQPTDGENETPKDDDTLVEETDEETDSGGIIGDVNNVDDNTIDDVTIDNISNYETPVDDTPIDDTPVDVAPDFDAMGDID
jgi:hypothetical protein